MDIEISRFCICIWILKLLIVILKKKFINPGRFWANRPGSWTVLDHGRFGPNRP
jgi:hypothetical protein